MNGDIVTVVHDWLCREARDMSEAVYAAGWHSGWERVLWDAANSPAYPEAIYVSVMLPAERLRRLVSVAKEIGAWPISSQETMPLQEWLERSNAE